MPNNLLNYIIFLVGAALLASNAAAELAREDLPPDVQWYAHADFKEMEGSVTGKYILDFLEKEVFSELREETGIDARRDLTAVTVFGGQLRSDGAVVLFGKISDKNRTKIQALMELYGDYERDAQKGVEIFSLRKRDAGPRTSESDSDEMFLESRTTHIAFGKHAQTLITQSRAQLDAFVAAGGRVTRGKQPEQAGSLLILKADRGLVKAGMNSGAAIAGGQDWSSNVLRHMQQVALVLADQSGKAAIDLQLVTNKPELAESIRNILQGLISIKSLDRDEDPHVQALLNSIKLDLVGSTIRATMLLDPEILKEAMH